MSAQQSKKSTMQNLQKRLDISETELLIAIKQLGLNPSEVEENWGDAIANHLTGTHPQKLNGTVPKPETPTPESFSIEDSDDFVDWDEIEDELGETALALVQELGLEREAVTRSDFAALKELALSNPVAEDMVNVRFV